MKPNAPLKNQFRVNNFDLLRIIAASQVVLGHTVGHLDIDHPWGWSLVEAFPGVPIFFGVSGFLISASYERSSSLVSSVSVARTEPDGDAASNCTTTVRRPAGTGAPA